jgi:hypothetical protein
MRGYRKIVKAAVSSSRSPISPACSGFHSILSSSAAITASMFTQ